MEKELPKVIDLFCGAGGMSLGFQQAGFEIAAGFDFDEKSIETYNFNFNKKGHCIDLKNVNGEKIRELANLEVDEECIVIGGPPCQGFSLVNGKRNGTEKNQLIIQAAELISEIKPTFFVIENVPTATNIEGGQPYQKFEKTLKKSYKFESKILNSVEFGVPQKRRRLFVIGNNTNLQIEFPTGNPELQITVEEAISDLPELDWKIEGNNPTDYNGEPVNDYQKLMREIAPEKLWNHIITVSSEKIIERYRQIKQGESYKDVHETITGEKIKVNYSNVYRRFKAHEPATTIANPRKSMYIHYSQDRGLSVREAARLQSFPDSFIFQSTKSYQQQQVANAVPPLLIKSIANVILQTFYKS